jgi:hypothetical protein
LLSPNKSQPQDKKAKKRLFSMLKNTGFMLKSTDFTSLLDWSKRCFGLIFSKGRSFSLMAIWFFW